RPAPVEPGLALEPLRGGLGVSKTIGHALSHRAQLRGELGGARGTLAEPEGDRRRGAPGVLDPHPAALDPADAPGGVAEQDHVARYRLDREVLVERSDGGL